VSDEPERLTGRLLDVCVGLLLAGLALYGAVYLVLLVWVQLAIIGFVVLIIGITGWLLFARFRRW